MCFVIIFSILSVSIMLLIAQLFKTNQIIKNLTADLEEQNNITHTQRNDLCAVVGLVDLTWGGKSNYEPNEKEKNILKTIKAVL